MAKRKEGELDRWKSEVEDISNPSGLNPLTESLKYLCSLVVDTVVIFLMS